MVYVTSSAMKQFFREQFARYFRTDEPDCIISLYNIVVSLWSIKTVNTIAKDFGEEDYKRIETSMQALQEAYNYAGQVRRAMTETKEAGADEKKEAFEALNRKLISISMKLPIIRQDIMRAFFLLVNNTDLRNIAIESVKRGEGGRYEGILPGRA